MKKNNSTDNSTAKKAAANAAAEYVENGMIIGLGTGSTAFFLIEALSIKYREGLSFSAIATSKESASQALRLGIPLVDSETILAIDLTIDGADEIDPNKNMIKGGGGALFKEKLAARSSKELIVIVDSTKLVDRLGRFPLPLEISRFLYRHTLQELNNLGYKNSLRAGENNTPFVTDNENYIVDVQYQHPIIDLNQEHLKLKSISGVIETGLFYGLAGRVIVGKNDGSIEIF